MLGDAGSIASLAGVAISLFGLGFAILQLRKLRGETRAATEAALETRQAVSREVAGITLARVNERIEGLKDLHRRGEWNRAQDRYPEIRRMLIDIRVRHPEMSDKQRIVVQRVVTRITQIDNSVENAEGEVSQLDLQRFNRQLTGVQSQLAEVESQLQQST